MPRKPNPAYNEQLASLYRRVALVMRFEMEVQGLQQVDVARAACDIAERYNIPIDTKPTSMVVQLNTLLNDRYLEQMPVVPDTYRVGRPQKLVSMTPERLAVLLHALGLTEVDFLDRFLVELPEGVAAVLEDIHLSDEVDLVMADTEDFMPEPIQAFPIHVRYQEPAGLTPWNRIGSWFNRMWSAVN